MGYQQQQPARQPSVENGSASRGAQNCLCFGVLSLCSAWGLVLTSCLRQRNLYPDLLTCQPVLPSFALLCITKAGICVHLRVCEL